MDKLLLEFNNREEKKMRITRNRKFLIGAALSLLFFIILGNNTFAITEVKLLATDGAAEDQFGDSVSISGNVALVGAEGDDDKGIDSGSVYVFRWNGSSWVEGPKLLASDGAAGDQFGQSVSISGDVALVGAPEEDNNSPGKAYVFRWNGSNWVEGPKLLASDGAAGDNFGQSVSISGDVALVGAEGDDDKGDWSGSAYVFRRDGNSWGEEQKLIAPDGAAQDGFGGSVSISGDVALVGAYNGDGNSTDSGSAYVFRWDGRSWVEEQELIASDGATDDGFGGSVTISGDVALVGASEEEKDLPDAGSGMAYVFRWDGNSWGQEQKLLASDGAAGDQFGQSVSISGDLALVGAEQIEFVLGKGKAYIFQWNGSSWVELEKLIASDGAIGDRVGYKVSISGNMALVGASGDDDKGSGSGSAYIFVRKIQTAIPPTLFLLFQN